MKYVEYSVKTTAEAEDLVADVMLSHTDFGVSVISGNDAIELVNGRKDTFDYVDEKIFEVGAGVSFVKGAFPIDTAERDIAAVRRELEDLRRSSQGYFDLGELSETKRVFENDDWIKIRRAALKPIEFDKLCVCLPEAEFSTDKKKVVIATDLAFGMGDHETTSMCVSYLEKYVKRGYVVADVGTGSGILGICAAKLGASKVYMTDNDPVAVEAAKTNVSVNGEENKCFPTLSNLLDGLTSVCDLVVANITADVLVLLKDDVSKLIKEGGYLIMSGILDEKIDLVVNEYDPLGFRFFECSFLNGWKATVATKLRRT